MLFSRLILLFSLLCLTLCHAEEKPLILVSIPTYQNIVQEIVGGDFSVESIVPENTNFHSYEPSMQKILLYTKARIWFTIGDPFEERLKQFLLSQDQPPEIVSLQKGIEIHKHCCCSTPSSDNDPHSWTSPKSLREQLKVILSTMTTLFHSHKETIESNYTKVDAKMASLIATVDDLLASTHNKPLIIAHAAFGYLCQDYDIEQIALEKGGKEPTPAWLQNILQEGTKHHVTTVFSLKGFSTKGIERIAETLQAKIIELDPYLCPYFASMEYTALAIKRALDNEV